MSLHADYKALSARLAAVASLPWARSPLAAGELAEATALLRAERRRQGLTLQDMQQATGITRSSLHRIENQEGVNPSIGTLERIAGALGMKLLVALVEEDGQNDKVPAGNETSIQQSAP